MKGRIVIAAIFLLAGAVVTVAVAWGLAAFVNVFGPHRTVGVVITAPSATVPYQYWQVERFERTGGVRIISVWIIGPPSATTRMGSVSDLYRPGESRVVRDPHPASLVPKWTDLRRPPHDSVRNVILGRQLDGRGWPMITLWCDIPTEAQPLDDHLYLPSEGRGAIEFPDRPWKWDVCRYPRTLPLLPFWPGFIVNTAVYAGVLWLLILGPFALRRLIRQRRGLCPPCGYDLRHGEQEACPECGATA